MKKILQVFFYCILAIILQKKGWTGSEDYERYQSYIYGILSVPRKFEKGKKLWI